MDPGYYAGRGRELPRAASDVLRAALFFVGDAIGGGGTLLSAVPHRGIRFRHAASRTCRPFGELDALEDRA